MVLEHSSCPPYLVNPDFGVAGDVAEELEAADADGHAHRREQRVHLRSDPAAGGHRRRRRRRRERERGKWKATVGEREQDDLLSDLKDIPKKACDRRINEFVKRARAAKIHAHIIGHLKKEMPAMMGKAKAQQRLIDNLENEFAKVQREQHLPAGDFPYVEHFRDVLGGYSIDKFEKIKPKMVQAVDDMLGYDIPELLKNFRNPYE